MSKNVLIVGASSGIGLATAVRLAQDGANLTLVSRDARALDIAAGSCRDAGAGAVRVDTADVLEADEVKAAVDGAVEQFGVLDAVVHTAAVMGYGEIESIPADVFTGVVDTAIHGTLHLAQAVLPVLRRQKRGTFVIVNSLLGSIAVPNMGAYATSKWGQRAMVRTLQQETRDEPDVHVCMVSPGSINTPIYYLAANYTGKDARPPVPVLQPERAAESIVHLLDRPRKNVSIPVGPANPVVITGFRLMPTLYDTMVGPLFRLAALTRRDRPASTGNVHRPESEKERVHGHWPDR